MCEITDTANDSNCGHGKGPSQNPARQLSALLANMLHTRAEPELGRKLAERYISELCREEELYGAALFVWDWEVEDYVLIHGIWSEAKYRLKNRYVLNLLRRAANLRQPYTVAMVGRDELENSGAEEISFVSMSIPLDVEGRRVGAVALFSNERIQVSDKVKNIQEFFSCFLIAHQHLIHAQELQRVHNEMENRRNYFARLLEQLEERNSIIEQMNLELRNSREHVQRLATLGELAASISHEINNPLAYVVSCIDYVSKELQKLNTLTESSDGTSGINLPDLCDSIDCALEGAQRIRVISSDLTALSRSGGHSMQSSDVNKAVHTAVRILGPMLRNNVRLDMDLTSDLVVLVDVHQLAQVLVNLLVNAVDAIVQQEDRKELGLVSIRTYRAEHRIVIAVQDNGPGVDAAIVGRIMSPFFTTKSVGEGTGLGLSISQEIVKRFGGTLMIYDTNHIGACFLIDLPDCNSKQANRIY